MTDTTATSAGATRRLLALSASAIVVLAAEPTYVLVDTAVVGHLGSVPLGGLAVAGALMALLTVVGTFVEYGTTSRAARWFGAGRTDDAINEGVQASWLAVGIGAVLVLLGEVFAGPLTGLLAGGSSATQHAAESWFRIGVIGMPGVLLVLAGNGWMRGVQRTREPVVIVIAANALSAVLCPLLVYPAGLGLEGSAIANLIAQTVGAALFLRSLSPRGAPRPSRPEGDARATGGRSRSDRALGRVPGRVPHRGRRRVADGHRADRGTPDRPAAVGVHRTAAGLVRDRGAVAGRRGARRIGCRPRRGRWRGRCRGGGCTQASGSPRSTRPAGR